MIKFDPEPERPVWIQVMEIIRKRIQDGTYPPRAKIPSLKQIAQEFEVGMNTARHVVENLTDQGLVRPVRSMGTFVVPQDGREVEGAGD